MRFELRPYFLGGKGRHQRYVLLMTLALACVFCNLHTAVSQTKISSNWYFGQYAGITFSGGDARSLDDSRMTAGRSSAVISDPSTGELLFYTDGVTVWNRYHEVMPNGTGLMGDPTTSQGVLVVPAPGRPGIYYLFNAAPTSASDAAYRCLCLYYSIIDMRASNGLGDITTKNEFVLSDVTEHLTATLDCRGDSWWIITRSRVSRHFYSLRLGRDYLETTPVVSAVGNPLLEARGAGQLHVSPDNRRMLLTSTTGSSQLFDFDGQTGRVTGGTSLFGAENKGEHYGAAFSPDGRRAYITVSNADNTRTTQLFQFNVSLKSAADVSASKALVADLSQTSSWVPLQLGPDGRVYVGIPGMRSLSVIQAPNNDAPSVNFERNAIALTGSVRSGLPNIPAPLLFEAADRNSGCVLPVADFSAPSILCAGTTAAFVDKSSGNVESWQWQFEGAIPSTSTERNPSKITYTAAGTYTVRLIVRSVYGIDTATSKIEVLRRPSLVTDSNVIACPDSPLQLRVSGADSYRWTPATAVSDPTSPLPIVRVRTTTRLTVIGTGSDGCTDTATVLVRVPTTSVSANATICRGASVQLRASGGSAYAWSPSTGLSDTTSASPVANPRETTTYVVTIDLGDCTVRDTVRVTVLDSLIVRIEGPSQACAGDTVTLRATAGTAFEWTGPGLLKGSADTARVVVPADGSRIELRVQSGLCAASDVIDIAPYTLPKLTVQPSVRICSGERVRLTADAGGASIRWFPSAGLDVDTGGVVTASPRISTTYLIEATGETGCSVRDTIRVTVTPTPSVNAGADLSICAGVGKRLLASGFGEAFSWSPADGLSDPTSLTPVASPTVTTTYVLRSQIGSCEEFDTVTVYVSRLRVRLTGDTTACRGNAVRIQASGAWQYRWSPTLGLVDSTSATQSFIADTTVTYTVTGVDGLGCTETQSITIVVRDTVSLSVTAGTISATAGQDSVGIPVIVDVPEHMLPLHLDEMRATLVNDVGAFFPTSTDRGDLRVSIRGKQRLSHLRIQNIELISPRQRVTSLRGIVLSGQIISADLLWENVELDAAKCPALTVTPGIMYINGCNILKRLIKTFTVPKVGVRVRPRDHIIDVDMQAELPGQYEVRLTTLEGSTVYVTEMTIYDGDRRSVTDVLDMSERSSGAYYLLVRTPLGQTMTPVMWMP